MSIQRAEAHEQIVRTIHHGRPGQELLGVGIADGGLAGAPHRVHVHVRPVVIHREEHVAWISADAEVGRSVVHGETIEGCVRLDETTVLLRVEGREQGVEFASLLVEPRRDMAEGERKVRILEDQERAQHLQSTSCRTSETC